VVVELSPAVYVALCGLVQDALQYPSDATHLLKRAAEELTRAALTEGLDGENSENQPAEEETIHRRIAAVG
jgi:hypothetical protein